MRHYAGKDSQLQDAGGALGDVESHLPAALRHGRQLLAKIVHLE